MLTLTRRELETKKKLELLEEFDPSILLKTRQFLNTEISKGIITQQDYDEFWPKESGSFTPVLVIENDLTKNLRLIRPQQVMFDQDTIQKSIGERKGYYMNTLRNRELDIVGMPWGYDIIKGKKAEIGEIRYYGGIPYRKVTSTGNANKDWQRVKDIPKKPGAKGGEKHEGKVEEGNFKVTLNSGHDIREITIKEVDGQFLPVIHDIYKDDKSPVHSSELIYHKTKESAIKQAEEFADKLIKIGYKKEPTTPEKKSKEPGNNSDPKEIIKKKFLDIEKSKYEESLREEASSLKQIQEYKSKGYHHSKEYWKKDLYNKAFNRLEKAQRNLEKALAGHSLIKNIMKGLGVTQSTYRSTAIRGYSIPSKGYEFSDYNASVLGFNGFNAEEFNKVKENLVLVGFEIVGSSAASITFKPYFTDQDFK